MAIIIINTSPEYLRTVLLPAQGTLKDFYVYDNKEFLGDLIYKNLFIYALELRINGTASILQFNPITRTQQGKELLPKAECLKLVEILRSSLIKYCQKNNLTYTTFPKYNSYDQFLAGATETAQKLIKIGVLQDKVLPLIPGLVEDSYGIDDFYSSIHHVDIWILSVVCRLAREIAVDKDYYEFFGDLADEPIKADYETLIGKILQLAGISKKDYTLTWAGSFDNLKPEDGPQATLSHCSIIIPFKLKYEGEKVDTENLLKGLNAFIKAQFPAEKRKFQMLQIYDDQTGCVWFVTEKQLKQLCPLIHARWDDFPGHYCEVTRAEVLRKKGPKGVLELYKRSAQREWERLSNVKWKVYPARQ